MATPSPASVTNALAQGWEAMASTTEQAGRGFRPQSPGGVEVTARDRRAPSLCCARPPLSPPLGGVVTSARTPGRPARHDALTAQRPDYLRHMYRKDPHVPLVTSIRSRAETTGVYPLGHVQSPVRTLATAH
jgi:hypothetical protein